MFSNPPRVVTMVSERRSYGRSRCDKSDDVQPIQWGALQAALQTVLDRQLTEMTESLVSLVSGFHNRIDRFEESINKAQPTYQFSPQYYRSPPPVVVDEISDLPKTLTPIEQEIELGGSEHPLVFNSSNLVEFAESKKETMEKNWGFSRFSGDGVGEGFQTGFSRFWNGCQGEIDGFGMNCGRDKGFQEQSLYGSAGLWSFEEHYGENQPNCSRGRESKLSKYLKNEGLIVNSSKKDVVNSSTIRETRLSKIEGMEVDEKKVVGTAEKTGDEKVSEDKLHETENLEKVKASLTQEDLAERARATHELNLKQETHDLPEALECVPSLPLQDIPKKPIQTPTEVRKINGTKVLQHNLFTNDVVYDEVEFNVSALELELLPLASLLCQSLLEMGTKDMDSAELKLVAYLYILSRHQPEG